MVRGVGLEGKWSLYECSGIRTGPGFQSEGKSGGGRQDRLSPGVVSRRYHLSRRRTRPWVPDPEGRNRGTRPGPVEGQRGPSPGRHHSPWVIHESVTRTPVDFLSRPAPLLPPSVPRNLSRPAPLLPPSAPRNLSHPPALLPPSVALNRQPSANPSLRAGESRVRGVFGPLHN